MARAPEKEDSVYDFLYIDTRRLAHFLSQFSQFGHLTSLTRSASESSTSSGGLNVHVAKLDSEISTTTEQIKQFDATWIAPLTFLDEASRRGMINRGLERAGIGNLVLVTGKLALFDLSLIQGIWSSQPALAAILKNHAAGPNTPAALDLLKMMPHKILATLREGESSVWCTMSEDSLLTTASDLILKHGMSVAGDWIMIGVLDAIPSTPLSSPSDQSDQESAAKSLGSMVAHLSTLGSAIRGLLGRPAGSYGMTPLLVFREVSA